MYYTIYKTTNNINNKIYIGKHQTNNIHDSYFGSGKVLKDAIKKYGKENFTKEVLFVFDGEFDMNNKEIELIDESFVNRKDTYNIGIGGEGGSHFKGKFHTNETKSKLREIRKLQKPMSLETKEKISKIHKGKKVSTETRKKLSNYVKTDEHKRNISESLKRNNKDNCNSGRKKGIKVDYIWIYNLKLKESKLIKKDLNIPEGWLKGRKMFKGW